MAKLPSHKLLMTQELMIAALLSLNVWLVFLKIVQWNSRCLERLSQPMASVVQPQRHHLPKEAVLNQLQETFLEISVIIVWHSAVNTCLLQVDNLTSKDASNVTCRILDGSTIEATRTAKLLAGIHINTDTLFSDLSSMHNYNKIKQMPQCVVTNLNLYSN